MRCTPLESRALALRLRALALLGRGRLTIPPPIWPSSAQARPKLGPARLRNCKIAFSPMRRARFAESALFSNDGQKMASKRPLQSCRMPCDGPRMIPRWTMIVAKESKVARNGPKMASTWFQDGIPEPRKSSKIVLSPRRRAHFAESALLTQHGRRLPKMTTKGPILETLGAILGPLGAILGPFWGNLGTTFGHLNGEEAIQQNVHGA